MPLGTPTRRMPIPEEVGDFLGDLLGTPVAASKAPKAGRGDITDAPEGFVTGVFLDDRDQIGGACITDIKLAASAGAALAMMPSAVVDEAVKAEALTETLHENFYEVANIMTRLLNGPSVPHLRIIELVAGVPEEIQTLLASAAGIKYYDVTVVGYPGGRMTLVASAP